MLESVVPSQWAAQREVTRVSVIIFLQRYFFAHLFSFFLICCIIVVSSCSWYDLWKIGMFPLKWALSAITWIIPLPSFFYMTKRHVDQHEDSGNGIHWFDIIRVLVGLGFVYTLRAVVMLRIQSFTSHTNAYSPLVTIGRAFMSPKRCAMIMLNVWFAVMVVMYSGQLSGDSHRATYLPCRASSYSNSEIAGLQERSLLGENVAGSAAAYMLDAVHDAMMGDEKSFDDLTIAAGLSSSSLDALCLNVDGVLSLAAATLVAVVHAIWFLCALRCGASEWITQLFYQIAPGRLLHRMRGQVRHQESSLDTRVPFLRSTVSTHRSSSRILSSTEVSSFSNEDDSHLYPHSMKAASFPFVDVPSRTSNPLGWPIPSDSRLSRTQRVIGSVHTLLRRFGKLSVTSFVVFAILNPLWGALWRDLVGLTAATLYDEPVFAANMYHRSFLWWYWSMLGHSYDIILAIALVAASLAISDFVSQILVAHQVDFSALLLGQGFGVNFADWAINLSGAVDTNDEYETETNSNTQDKPSFDRVRRAGVGRLSRFGQGSSDYISSGSVKAAPLAAIQQRKLLDALRDVGSGMETLDSSPNENPFSGLYSACNDGSSSDHSSGPVVYADDGTIRSIFSGDTSLQKRLRQTYSASLYSLRRLGLHAGQIDLYSVRFTAFTSAPVRSLPHFMLHWAANGRGVGHLDIHASDGTEILAGPLRSDPVVRGSMEFSIDDDSVGVSGLHDKTRHFDRHSSVQQSAANPSNLWKSWYLDDQNIPGGLSDVMNARTSRASLNMVRIWQARMADTEAALYSSIVNAVPSASAKTRLMATVLQHTPNNRIFGQNDGTSPANANTLPVAIQLARNAALNDAAHNVMTSFHDRQEVWGDPSGNRFRALLWSMTAILDAQSLTLLSGCTIDSLPPAAKLLSPERVRGGCNKKLPIRLRGLWAELIPYDPVLDIPRRFSGGFVASEKRAVVVEAMNNQKISKQTNSPSTSDRGEENLLAAVSKVMNILLKTVRWNKPPSHHNSNGTISDEIRQQLPKSTRIPAWAQKPGSVSILGSNKKRNDDEMHCPPGPYHRRFGLSTPSANEIQGKTRRRGGRTESESSGYSSLHRSTLRASQNDDSIPNGFHTHTPSVRSTESKTHSTWEGFARSRIGRKATQRAAALLWDSSAACAAAKILVGYAVNAPEEDRNGVARHSMGVILSSLVTLHEAAFTYASLLVEDIHTEHVPFLRRSAYFSAHTTAMQNEGISDLLASDPQLAELLLTVRSCIILLLCRYEGPEDMSFLEMLSAAQQSSSSQFERSETDPDQLDEQLLELNIIQMASMLSTSPFSFSNRDESSSFSNGLGDTSIERSGSMHRLLSSGAIPLPSAQYDALQRIWLDISNALPFGTHLSLQVRSPVTSAVVQSSATHTALLPILAEDFPLSRIVKRMACVENAMRELTGNDFTDSCIFYAWDVFRRARRFKRLVLEATPDAPNNSAPS